VCQEWRGQIHITAGVKDNLSGGVDAHRRYAQQQTLMIMVMVARAGVKMTVVLCLWALRIRK
jgi:hypothetical protein